MVDITVRACLADGFGKVGERVVITLGVPFGTPGSTNLMRDALASSVIRFLPALAVLRCCECYEAVGSLPLGEGLRLEIRRG